MSIFRHLILFSLFCLSPVASTAADTPQQTAMAFIEAISARDAAATIALLAEDAVLEMPFPLAEGENAYGTRRMWYEMWSPMVYNINPTSIIIYDICLNASYEQTIIHSIITGYCMLNNSTMSSSIS